MEVASGSTPYRRADGSQIPRKYEVLRGQVDAFKIDGFGNETYDAIVSFVRDKALIVHAGIRRIIADIAKNTRIKLTGVLAKDCDIIRRAFNPACCKGDTFAEYICNAINLLFRKAGLKAPYPEAIELATV
jgi:hypothetical protein